MATDLFGDFRITDILLGEEQDSGAVAFAFAVTIVFCDGCQGNAFGVGQGNGILFGA